MFYFKVKIEKESRKVGGNRAYHVLITLVKIPSLAHQMNLLSLSYQSQFPS